MTWGKVQLSQLSQHQDVLRRHPLRLRDKTHRGVKKHTISVPLLGVAQPRHALAAGKKQAIDGGEQTHRVRDPNDLDAQRGGLRTQRLAYTSALCRLQSSP